jgi:hypothetical protein
VLFWACAYPDFQFDAEGTGGGVTTTSDGGTGGTHTGGTGGTSTGEAGTGGGVSCSLFTPGDCGAQQKCTIVDVQTGAIGCTVAGTKEIWERCNTDSDCIEGTWCDQVWSVCKPWCQNITDCIFEGGTFEGECVTALREDSTEIPGNPTHCVPNCEPVSGAPCATTDSVTCIYAGTGVFDCARSQNYNSGHTCTGSENCAAGLLCIGSGVGSCQMWCTPPAFFGCGLGSDCVPLDPTVMYKGAEYGVCN